MTTLQHTPDYRRAEALAQALVDMRVDPNEAQKALAYLRSRGRAQALFDYLGATTRDGRAVVRSNRTLGYYRDLLTACERHLGPLRGDYELLVRTYALALRLLRYYRAVPDDEQVRLEQLPAAPTVRETSLERRSIAAAPAEPEPPPRPAGPKLPEAGDIFTGKILELDESVAVIEVPGFAVEKAIGVLKAEQMGGRKYRAGNAARVQVTGARTLKNGRVVLELTVAPPQEKK